MVHAALGPSFPSRVSFKVASLETPRNRLLKEKRPFVWLSELLEDPKLMAQYEEESRLTRMRIARKIHRKRTGWKKYSPSNEPFYFEGVLIPDTDIPGDGIPR